MFLQRMHDSLNALTGGKVEAPAAEPGATFTPAVSARKSLASPDHIVSMIDGKPYRRLRRHLSTNGLTPDEYRARYYLKPDYPMVAASYSEARRSMAKSIALGRKRSAPPADGGAPVDAAPAADAPEVAAKPARRGRARKTAA